MTALAGTMAPPYNEVVRTFANHSIPIMQRGYCVPAQAANLTGQDLIVSPSTHLALCRHTPSPA
jgi:hypothetical protein